MLGLPKGIKMNSLSWMIYIADVAKSFGTFLGEVGSFFSALGIALGIVRVCVSVFNGDKEALSFLESTARTFMALIIIGPLLWAGSLLVPSRDAILMISASQMGQKIYENPGAQEIFGDVKEILTNELRKLKEKK